MTIKSDYDRWNEMLAAYFFCDERQDATFFLDVDEELLQEIYERSGGDSKQSAKESFIEAVRKRLTTDKDPLQKFFQNRLWKRPNIPPFFGFLAFCVLAASEMQSDEDVSVSNYYVHLNKLLGFPEKTKQPKPKGFENAEKLWHDLKNWLENDKGGKFGRISFPYKEIYGIYVDYPISQAILRRGDRQRLRDFFLWLDLAPKQSIELNYIQKNLLHYIDRSTCHFGKPLKNRIKDDSDLVARYVLKEYERWDGTALDENQKGHSFGVQLQLEIEKKRTELYLLPPNNISEGNYDGVLLEKDGFGTFLPLPDSITKRFLAGQDIHLKHQNEAVSLRLRPRKIIVFRKDSGSWVNCTRVEIGDEHAILFHDSVKNEVERILQGLDVQMQPKKGNALLDRWYCVSNICVTKVPARWLYGKESEYDSLRPLESRVASLRLEGGLLVKAPHLYMEGGEPRLIVETQEKVDLYQDGRKWQTIDSTTIFELRELRLRAGIHVFQVAAQEKSVTIYSGGEPLYQENPRGHLLVKSQGRYSFHSSSLETKDSFRTKTQGIWVSGSKIDYAPDEPLPEIEHWVTLKYGAEQYIILGKFVGEYVEHSLQSTIPHWEAQQKGLTIQGYSVRIPFAPQWLIRITDRGNERLEPLGHPQSPIKGQVDSKYKNEWLKWAEKNGLKRKLTKEHREYLPIWEAYNRLAKEEKTR